MDYSKTSKRKKWTDKFMLFITKFIKDFFSFAAFLVLLYETEDDAIIKKFNNKAAYKYRNHDSYSSLSE